MLDFEILKNHASPHGPQLDPPRIPTFRRVGHVCLPVAFDASPDLHGRFKCCPDSHSTSAFLSTCLTMFCTSATFTPTKVTTGTGGTPPLPFPAPPLLFIFCAHLTFHHSLSCPISHFPPIFPYAVLTALCPFWHIYCLDTGFERLPILPCWRYRWYASLCSFQRAQERPNLNTFTYCCISHVQSIQTHREHVRTTESTQYPSCIRLTSAHFGLPC
jgi:hypothetical protein